MTESSPTGLRKLYEKLILHFRALRAMGKDPMNGQLTTTEMCLALSQRAMLPEMNKKWEEYGKIYGPLLTTIDSRIHLMNVDAITVYGNEGTKLPGDCEILHQTLPYLIPPMIRVRI
ncbi:hypothetical protein T4E_11635 [Trichinella pseudospiralis]|uniref:Uncharacterized protein n=1 Tax=Trichinella pseudospiralis TaxID=6337 RepID=A0A0V0YHW0_TRIPS|nr:hypothetical protein T4E_11635 [Trichinella pseudospiralis]